MIRRAWRRLSIQTLAVLFAALVVSHTVGLTIYSLDHRETVLSTEAHDLANRVVGMVNLLGHIPGEWHDNIVRESDGQTFHVMLGSDPDPIGADLRPDLSGEVERYLLSQFPDWDAGRVLTGFNDDPFFRRDKILRDHSISNPETSLSDVKAPTEYGYLHISVRLDGDTWLNLVGALPRPSLFSSGWAWAYILSVATGVGAIAMWLVFRVSAPLTRLARAAADFGRDIHAAALPESGPIEVADASRAFNQMQENLRRLVDNRTQLLAAISHDLRTPVTLLRLRVEATPPTADRTQILRTLDEMEAMVASVLEFSRVALFDEPMRRVDLTSLIDSICSDLAEMNKPVHFKGAEPAPYSCRRIGMKRALMNLIDNAVKYGGSADVSLDCRPEAIEITIEDRGPGIPPEQQASVFLPFYRVDDARTPGKGGAGLGLSIAQTIIHGHGGTLTLANRETGGLRVRVVLPR